MKTNPKKVMGRRMLSKKERDAKVPYWQSKAWEERKENTKNRIAYNRAVPKAQRLKNRKANLEKNREASRARRLARAKDKKHGA